MSFGNLAEAGAVGKVSQFTGDGLTGFSPARRVLSGSPMSAQTAKFLKFGSAMVLILLALGYLAYTGVEQSKSYYVTIKELNGMGPDAYSKRLRVAGNVAPGSIKRQGTHLEFQLVEEGRVIPVVYSGTEAPPDTFKDNAQALAEGKYGKDGVFRATNIQAKCASKYAPKQNGQPGAVPAGDPSQQKAQLDGSQPGGQSQ
jgi:cytochrome c-type biogenesis protein CcmE